MIDKFVLFYPLYLIITKPEPPVPPAALVPASPPPPPPPELTVPKPIDAGREESIPGAPPPNPPTEPGGVPAPPPATYQVPLTF
jgi:hypothetical protein